MQEEFGPWQTVSKRHFLWSTDYVQIMDAVQEAGLVAESVVADGTERLRGVDSTVVRAYQHAAGARKDSITLEETSRVPGNTGGAVELQDSASRTV